MKSQDCQFPSLQTIAEGTADTARLSLMRRIKLMIRRRLSPGSERTLKIRTDKFINQAYQWVGRNGKPETVLALPTRRLQPGDRVRVRSKEEIEATLNNWRQLKGCTFMDEMQLYCGTTQRVFKSMTRFVDERDLQVKKCKGILLLEGVMCQGTTSFGRCDRSCLIFWREEWLEKID